MIDRKKLYEWCSVPADKLQGNPNLKVPLRVVRDSAHMGEVMARDLVEEIKLANKEKRQIRAIIPCGPMAWYVPFARMINEERVSMKNFIGLHMDECLDWHYPTPDNLAFMHEKAMEAPVDITLGGWGQDGHVAYNQARRNPYSPLTLDQLRESVIRVQDNNWDTVVAIAQRNFGGGYQFVAPMSITYGLKECFSAKKIRIFSDTGAWKQTALRVVLFGDEDPEYPFTLLHEHPDVIVTATEEVCRHPIAEHPEWKFRGINA